MPEEAGLATPPPEGQYKDWNGTRVPPSVFAALTEKYRGQKGLGTKQVEVLGFFTETARLKGMESCCAVTIRSGCSAKSLSTSHGQKSFNLTSSGHLARLGNSTLS